MNKLRCIFIITLFLLIGCSTIKIGSENHKATILYFEGGTGQIREGTSRLINRCQQLFYSKGMQISYMHVSHENSFKGVMTRLTYKHAQEIQIKIELPILVVTHEKDNSNMKELLPDHFKSICRSSPLAEIEVLSGGNVGTGPTATHLTQKYQHGLMGKEVEFVQIVSDFIDKCSNLTENRESDCCSS